MLFKKLFEMRGLPAAVRDTCRSSIGKKFIVAATGVVLLLFIFGHMAGNLLIFAGKDAIRERCYVRVQAITEVGALARLVAREWRKAGLECIAEPETAGETK